MRSFKGLTIQNSQENEKNRLLIIGYQDKSLLRFAEFSSTILEAQYLKDPFSRGESEFIRDEKRHLAK